MFPNQMIYDSNIYSRIYCALSANTHHDLRTFEVYRFASCIKNVLNRTRITQSKSVERLQHTQLTENELRTIKHYRKSLLCNKNESWIVALMFAE